MITKMMLHKFLKSSLPLVAKTMLVVHLVMYLVQPAQAQSWKQAGEQDQSGQTNNSSATQFPWGDGGRGGGNWRARRANRQQFGGNSNLAAPVQKQPESQSDNPLSVNTAPRPAEKSLMPPSSAQLASQAQELNLYMAPKLEEMARGQRQPRISSTFGEY